ncbi:MAG TPA: hypothetical protein VN155_16780 [Devosia sp.]|nr:hypothetical protein [Devosia sp.]
MSNAEVGIAVTAFIAGFGLGLVVMARMMRAKFTAALNKICDLHEANDV